MPISKQDALNAAKAGDLSTIKQYLLERGDINIRDNEKRTMLDLLMDEPHERMRENAKTILFLLTKNIDISQKSDIGDDRWYLNASVVHRAYFCAEETPEILDRLLAIDDIDINARCDDGYHSENTHFPSTAYAEEPEDGCVPMRSYTHGYSLEDATLLHFAAIRGDTEVINKICNHSRVDVNANASFILNGPLLGTDALIYAEAGHKEAGDTTLKPGVIAYAWVCRKDIKVIRVTNVTPLHLAARLGCKYTMRVLLEHKANPNAKDSDGRTPLEYLKDAIEEDSMKEDDANNLIEVFKQVSIEEKSEKQSYKKRLLLGEGNFSFANALVKKHATKKQKLAVQITATEYSGLEELKKVMVVVLWKQLII